MMTTSTCWSEEPQLEIDPNVLMKEHMTREWRMADGYVVFTKRDGTERTMNCTLRSDIVVPYEKKTERTHEPSAERMSVFDTDLQEWRSFRLDTVKKWHAGSVTRFCD
jgi:hypothetical protein